MKFFSFSKHKVKHMFLALTYFLVGVCASGYLSKEVIFILLGMYLSVSFVHLKSVVQSEKQKKTNKDSRPS